MTAILKVTNTPDTQTENDLPGAIDPRRFQPITPVPKGLTIDQVKTSLASISCSPAGSLKAYAEEDCERFLQTLFLIPDDATHVLEIGGNPYFLSTLIRRHRPQIELSITNYFGDHPSAESASTGPSSWWRRIFRRTRDGLPTNQTNETQALQHDRIKIKNYRGENETHVFDYASVNVEIDRFPYENAHFDCVLFCEVIEHLLMDPMHALLEIHRVLKPGGRLVLTTPNVARLENAARLIAGANLYDPYSGFGPYGRHNREFTRHELFRFLQHCGFENEVFFTGDVHENRARNYLDPARLEKLLSNRAPDLGQYHFSRWTKGIPRETRRPSWLYRSLPEAKIMNVDL